MTIYSTPFDPGTKKTTDVSTDSGFANLQEVIDVIGNNTLTRSGRVIIYPGGLMFSDYPVSIDSTARPA